jgi:hypothetical protein
MFALAAPRQSLAVLADAGGLDDDQADSATRAGDEVVDEALVTSPLLPAKLVTIRGITRRFAIAPRVKGYSDKTDNNDSLS